MHPQDEFVQRQARQRRQILPIKRHASRQRRGEQVGERDDYDVWITALAFDIEQSFRPCPARLIHGDKGLRRQVMLADERGDKPCHHVCPTTRASWDDELDRFLRFPCLCPSLPWGKQHQDAQYPPQPYPVFHRALLPTGHPTRAAAAPSFCACIPLDEAASVSRANSTCQDENVHTRG